MRLRAGARSDKGQIRSINEDAYVCYPERGLFVVCDGMGGEAAGEVASQLAVETIAGQLDGGDAEARKASGEAPTEFLVQTQRLRAAVEASNQTIHQRSLKNSQQAGMGATVVSAWIGDDIASVAHAGDSRAYLWNGNRLEQLTRDHSLVEEKVRAGLLRRDESLQSEEQNVLLRVLGREPRVQVDLTEVPLMPGDCLLLCTDGLTRMVSDSTLAEAIARGREPQAICDELVALANRNGGVDNITVVVVQAAHESLWQRLRQVLGG